MSQRTLRITDELSLPLDLITMRTAEYGDSGAGKTAFARLIAETVHDAKHRFCAIDLKNDWWGLKSSADGASEGIPAVVFGGPRRDVQLFDGAGEVVAETVASIEQSVILDLDAMSKARQIRFLTAFLSRLYEVNRHPLLLICDEADRYAPQKPMSPEAIMSLSASEDVCRRGRKRGIGQMWLTQRTAVLNKNISDICQMTVVFRTPGARDLNELEDRVGRIASKQVVAEVLRQAPALEDGQAFFLSSNPKLRKYMPDPVRPIQLPMPRTFDSSATPGVGQRRREPKVLARTDLAMIETKMAEQVQQAKANDPKELKQKLAAAQAELAKFRAAPAPSAKVETKTVEKPVISDKQIAAVGKLADKLDPLVAKAMTVVSALEQRTADARALGDQIAAGVKTIEAAVKLARTPAPPAAPAVAVQPRNFLLNERHQVSPPTKAQGARLREPVAEGAPEGMATTHQRLLNAIAWLNTFGIREPERGMVAAIAGASALSSAFENNVSRLRSWGLIDYPQQGRVVLTDAGRKLAAAPETPPTLDALHQAWRDSPPFQPAHVRILDAIIQLGPQDELSRQELAERAGASVKSSAFENNVSRLSSLGLLRYPRPGFVRASELLFPPGLV